MKQLTLLFIFTLCLTPTKSLFSQSTINGPGAAGHNPIGGVGLNYCGWQGGAGIPFNVEHRGTLDINFLTGGTQRMTILGTGAGANAGNVGIGIALPTQKLVVSNGNIDVNTASNGFMINNTMTLWRGSAGTISNIFGGAGAENLLAENNTRI